MPATQVTEGVHRLTQGVVNFYLVEEGGRLLLVDAALPDRGHDRGPAAGAGGRAVLAFQP
jgi:hypothetical protein